MVTEEVVVKCPACGSENITKQGKPNGKQTYRCNNPDCYKKYFTDSYVNRGCLPEVRQQVLTMTANGNGTRATARILKISKNTVTAILKEQENKIWQVNYSYINKHRGDTIEIDIISSDQIEVNETEMDEMWSFVHDKSQQYWLWWAIDHNTGDPLAFCFGTREHKHVDELLELLSAFQINIIYADSNSAYQTHTKNDETVVVSKKNTQRIERKHLSLRTWCSRLVRRGIRFSKTHQMHRIVVGLIINMWFFGRTAMEFLG